MLAGLIVLLYSICCSLLLTFFWHTPGFAKHFFSLGAVIVGMYFYRKHPSKRLRISFVILTLVFWIIFFVVFSLFSENV